MGKIKIKKLESITDLETLVEGDVVNIQFEAKEVYVDGKGGCPLVNKEWIYLRKNGEQIIFTQPGGFGTKDVYVYSKNVKVKEGGLIASGKVCFTNDIFGRSDNHQKICKLLKSAGFELSPTYSGGGF